MIRDKKIVLITGATGVIGSSLAEHFVRAGYFLVLTGRSQEKLSELKKKLGSNVFTYSADISLYDGSLALAELIGKEFGKLDVIILTAGIYGEIGTVEQIDPERWQDAFSVNVYGAVYTAKAMIPLLKKSGSASIIFFAGGGEGPLPNFSSYASSKWAILRLAETLAYELNDFKIRVNTIYPGLINSGFVQNIIAAGPERAGKEAYERAHKQLQGEAETVTPDKAGELCLFLASEEAEGITGKLFAARWDDVEKIKKYKKEIINSDIYTTRRIKPKDRGYDW